LRSNTPYSLCDEVSQAFVVFLPFKSAGVVGDAERRAEDDQ